jgi:hypothetical protein
MQKAATFGGAMPHALNMTLPLKQDPASKQKLAYIAENFSKEIQPAIDKALAGSKIVHFARVLVIDGKYLQVITEYDGSHKEYTEFFRKALSPVFEMLFSLAEGAPPWDQLDQNSFFEFSKKFNVKALGTATDGSVAADGQPAGYLFSAYGDKTVKEILPKL